jgi:hypothetical protein
MSWNPFNWIGLTTDGRSTDDLTAEEADYQARAATLNRERLEAGRITQEQFDRAETVRRTNATDVAGEIGAAAKEGAKEGLQALPNTVRTALNDSFGWGVSFIPWYGWLGLLLAGVWYTGGFTYLRGVFARSR